MNEATTAISTRTLMDDPRRLNIERGDTVVVYATLGAAGTAPDNIGNPQSIARRLQLRFQPKEN